MDNMDIDAPSPPDNPNNIIPPNPLKPRDRILLRLAQVGVPEEYLEMQYSGIVAFAMDNWSRVPELVTAILLSDEEEGEVLWETKKVENAPVWLHFRESVVWLEWLMFRGDPMVALKRLSKLSSERGVCGVVWGNNDIAYTCRTCGHDPTCAICIFCFMNGNHKDHDYSVIYTGGGCCDCGDLTAWKREGFCSSHKGAEQIKPLPEEFARSVGPGLDALFGCWKEKLVSVETIHQEKSGSGEFFAGRQKAANKLTFAVVEMVLDFCKYSESLLSFVSKRVVSLVGLLEILVRAEGVLSESVVKKLHAALLKLLGEPTFKYEFAKAFLSYYPFVVQAVTKEGRDDALKKYPLLSKFSVQILTVPTLTLLLVKEMNLLAMLMGCLENIFVHCAGDDGCLLVSKWGNLYDISIRVVKDIRFVLSLGVVAKYVNNEQRDILKAWMKLLGFLQGMGPLTRETGIHIEEENEDMNLPFVLGHSIADIHSLLVDAAFSSGKDIDDYTGSPFFKQDMDEEDNSRRSKVGRLSQESFLHHGLARNTICVSPLSNTDVESVSGGDLLPSSVTWLTSECLRAIDSWLEPGNVPGALPSQSNGVMPNKKFLSFKRTLSMIRRGKCIFGGLSGSSENDVSPWHMENSYDIELDSRTVGSAVTDLKVFDIDMEGGSSRESNGLRLLSLPNWPLIAYDVSSQNISIHIPLHRFLSLLLRKALSWYFGESVVPGVSCTDFSYNDFFGIFLEGCHPSGLSAFIMEHPLRNRVFFAEVHAGMWRKNGDAAIMSCEWYRSVSWAEQGLELDLFLLQCCCAMAPANDYIRRIIERFGLSDYLSLNSEIFNEYESILVQEMLALIIQIVQERRFSGLTPTESLRRELVHKLAVGDATRSQIVKSLPRDLSKLDQLQEILDSVAVYSNPSGFNQGTYSLRWTCWKELDLYYPRWNSRDLQVAEERFMRYCSTSALTTQLPRWTKIFMPLRGIARLATCEVALQIIHAVLYYAVFSVNSVKTRAPDGVILSALHLLSLALDICFQHRESGDTPISVKDMDSMLAFASQEIHETGDQVIGDQSLLALLVTLMRMQKRETECIEAGSCSFYALIGSLLKRFAELNSGCMGKLLQLAPEVVMHLSQPIFGVDESTSGPASDSERRKAKARERQVAILEKMKAEQFKFLSSMDAVADDSSSGAEESILDEQPFGESLGDVCSLCHDQSSKSPLSFLVLLQKSRLLSFSGRVCPSWDLLSQYNKEQPVVTNNPTDHSSGSEVISSTHITQLVQNAVNAHAPPEKSRDGINANVMMEQDMYLSIWKEVCENGLISSYALQTQKLPAAEGSLERSNDGGSILTEKYVASVVREMSEKPSASDDVKNDNVEIESSSQAAAYDGFGPTDCDGVHLSSCGHAVHQQCLDRYLISLKERYVRRIVFEGGHIVNPDQGEFLCPVCRRLSNSVLPMLPGDFKKGWEKPPISIVGASEIETSTLSNGEDKSMWVKKGFSLLQSASNVIKKGVILKAHHLQEIERMEPELDSISCLLFKLYFPDSEDKFSVFSRVNLSMIMWDTLKYSISSIEIAARGGRTHLEPVYNLDVLYQDLKSSTGFALSLLLKTVHCLRSKNLFHVLQRFQGIQLFADSICLGVSMNLGHRELQSVLKRIDKGVTYPETQFWNRAADPVLARDAFSSLMWVLFCLPWPFLSCKESFFSLVRVFYAVTIAQAVITCCRVPQLMANESDLKDSLIGDISRVSEEYGWIQQYFVSSFTDSASDIKQTIRRLTFPYLRRCVLLWKLLSASILAPFCNSDAVLQSANVVVADTIELHEIEELERTFQIPPLDFVLNDQALRSLVMRWFHHFQEEYAVRLSQSTLQLTPAIPFKLMHLPYLYQDLLQRCIKQRCVDCKNVIEDPLLCLLCGKLCSPNWKSCCRENQYQSHAKSCGAGTGVFLLVKRITILLQRCTRQAPWPSLYLDAFGEEDSEMQRGKPLCLNEERFAALTYMFASHGLDRSSEVLGQSTIGFLLEEDGF